MVPDEIRAPLVIKLFEYYATGTQSLKSLEKLCKEWDLTSNKSLTGNSISKNLIDRILKEPFYYGEMYVEKYNKFYPHRYQTLISRYLFDRCKQITKSRSEQGKKQGMQITKKEFIFRGLITCGVTGRRVSCDNPKNRHGTRYTYLIAWDPKNPEKKIYVKEEEVLSQIMDVFESISIPQKLLDQTTKYLQSSNEPTRKNRKAD